MDHVRSYKKNNRAFSAVLLPNLTPPKVIAVPAKWIMCPSTSKYLKRGMAKYDVRKVFYSVNPRRRANFFLPIQIGLAFDANVQAVCYRGHLKGTFG